MQLEIIPLTLVALHLALNVSESTYYFLQVSYFDFLSERFVYLCVPNFLFRMIKKQDLKEKCKECSNRILYTAECTTPNPPPSIASKDSSQHEQVRLRMSKYWQYPRLRAPLNLHNVAQTGAIFNRETACGVCRPQ